MKTRLKHVGAALGVLLALLAGAGLVQDNQHHRNEQAIQAAGERVDFWREIAGENTNTAPSLEKELAKSLQEKLGERNATATSLPVEIQNFKAPLSTYGGLQEAVGTTLDQSGPNWRLTPGTKAYLLDIKKGNVEEVLQKDMPQELSGYTFTPFGMPVSLTGGIVVLVAGSYLYGPVLLKRRKEQALNKTIKKTYGSSFSELEEIERALETAKPVTSKDMRAIEEIRSSTKEMREKMEQGVRNGTQQDVSPNLQGLRLRTEDVKAHLQNQEEAYRDLTGG